MNTSVSISTSLPRLWSGRPGCATTRATSEHNSECCHVAERQSVRQSVGQCPIRGQVRQGTGKRFRFFGITSEESHLRTVAEVGDRDGIAVVGIGAATGQLLGSRLVEHLGDALNLDKEEALVRDHEEPHRGA